MLMSDQKISWCHFLQKSSKRLLQKLDLKLQLQIRLPQKKPRLVF